MKLVPSRDCRAAERCIGCGIDCIPRKSQSSSLCRLLLRLGSGATVVFMLALDAFNAAHRLICACQMRSRPSALILRRFLAF
jgi:hypothetical protein